MKRTACILSLTPVTDEPRVLRQSKALADAGYRVVVAGYKGRAEPASWWDKHIEVAHVERDGTFLPYRDQGWLRRKRHLGRFLTKWAEDYYWGYNGYDGIYEHVGVVEDVKADLVLAHDYFTAPLAERLAKLSGGTWSVDCHECSHQQYMHDYKWRRDWRPWVIAMEKRFLPRAPVVTTVCDGIADLLQSTYGLSERPTVVRSAAFYQESAYREPGEKIGVLYHGILSQMRGLEQAIESLPLWRPEFELIIRGPGPDDYRAELRALAVKHGVQDRVRLEEAVPAKEMINRANETADVGYFVQPDISAQKRFTLPNKFFEYIMAGLALCVADLPEMARIVRKHDVGVLPKGTSPMAIAAAINSLTRERIEFYKRRSLEAAKKVCWEQEAPRMLEAYERALVAV